MNSLSGQDLMWSQLLLFFFFCMCTVNSHDGFQADGRTISLQRIQPFTYTFEVLQFKDRLG